jgi:hypothetical protein
MTSCGITLWEQQGFTAPHAWDNRSTQRRMLKEAVQQGRSENDAGGLFQHPA